MAYTNPKVVSYTYTSSALTVGVTDTWKITPPPGCTQCRVVDINAYVTTTFTATTTSAYVAVGVPSNLTCAGKLSFGTTAATNTIGIGTQIVVGTATNNPLIPLIDLTGTANPAAISASQPAIEALGPVTVTTVAATGGTPAGAALINVTLAWF